MKVEVGIPQTLLQLSRLMLLLSCAETGSMRGSADFT